MLGTHEFAYILPGLRQDQGCPHGRLKPVMLIYVPDFIGQIVFSTLDPLVIRFHMQCQYIARPDRLVPLDPLTRVACARGTYPTAGARPDTEKTNRRKEERVSY